MSQVPTDFRKLGAIHVVKPSGQVLAYGLGAATDVARGTQLLTTGLGGSNAAVVGDQVVIGPSVFDLGLNLLTFATGVKVYGSGIDLTTIYSQRNVDQVSACVLPWTDGVFSNLTLWGNHATKQQTPLGFRDNDNPSEDLVITNFYGENLKIIGSVDAIHFNSTAPVGFTGYFRDCWLYSNFDTVALFGGLNAGSSIVLDNMICDARYGVGYTYPSYEGSIGVNSRGIATNLESTDLAITVKGGEYVAGGASTRNSCMYVQTAASGKITLGGLVKLTSSGTAALDLETTAGSIEVGPSVRYDTAKIAGAITKLAAYGTAPTAAGLAIWGGADAAAQRISLGITEGTWSPTLVIVANLDSTPTAVNCQYQRIGNWVYVSGQVSGVDPTAAALTRYAMPLPIASAFTDASDASGFAYQASAERVGTIIADVTNDRLEFRFTAAQTTSLDVVFHGSYRIKA